MKETIRNVKHFICFYLTLPLFVLALLLSGVTVSGNQREKKISSIIKREVRTEEINISTFPIQTEITKEKGQYVIAGQDLSKEYNILNTTSETVDEEELISLPLDYPYVDSLPLVLVIHTHATECYSEQSQSYATADINGNYGFYDSETETRSSDTSKNMIAVGEVFAEVLSNEGIGVIQCRTLNDLNDYNNAYKNAREKIEEYIKKFPSIKYIVDIHRDSLQSENGTKTKTFATEIEDCAQVMFVNGTVFDDWENNLALALKIKKVMDEEYPSLSRPIYLRQSKYNLDMTKASLLLEVGTCANTLEEAKKGARLSAECFAKVIKQES